MIFKQYCFYDIKNSCLEGNFFFDYQIFLGKLTVSVNVFRRPFMGNKIVQRFLGMFSRNWNCLSWNGQLFLVFVQEGKGHFD